MRLLVVDNHDSFTFNLVDYVQRVLGSRPDVLPNNASVSDWADYDAVIISPGPGTPHNPEDLGLSAAALQLYDGPILGVCLGMQAMVVDVGGTVAAAPRPVHGEKSVITHRGTDLFAGLDNPLDVVRYHSLIATDIPEDYQVTATVANLPMAIAHRSLPRWGVQFHPESLLSSSGVELISNFIQLARRHYAQKYYSLRTLDGALDPAEIASGFDGQVFSLDNGAFSILGDDSAPGSRHLICQDATEKEDFYTELAQPRLPDRVGPPIPGCDFALGWVGYLGYEMADIAGPARHRAPGPDAELIYATRAVVIDHARNQTHLLSFAGDEEWDIVKRAPKPAGKWQPELNLVHDREDYLDLIDKAQAKMRAGESYEVCLTNRIEMAPVPTPLETFIELRAANPSPRAGYLGFAVQQLLSTTPELFLRVDSNGVVHSRPIKGTRPRGANRVEDAQLRAELEGPKERAELLMVVDMVRNDLSRVCDSVRAGSFGVESYATVHQLMCEISGHLSVGRGPADAIRAAFPGGSMTGAPKVRTCEIIADLEDTWRGVYSGAFGFISPVGTADLSMVIRSIVNTPEQATYGMGGAVLAISDPVAEWEETLVKTRPLTEYLGYGL